MFLLEPKLVSSGSSRYLLGVYPFFLGNWMIGFSGFKLMEILTSQTAVFQVRGNLSVHCNCCFTGVCEDSWMHFGWVFSHRGTTLA